MTDKAKNTTAALAGVAGAVVGAGVAVAATKIATDKKMREKVVGTINQVKDQVFEALDENAQPQNSLKGGTAQRSLKQASGKSTSKKSQVKKNQGSSNSSDLETPDMAM